jgi:DNA-nicking Smr family endonuclease
MRTPWNRRQILSQTGLGFAGLAIPQLMQSAGYADTISPNPLLPKAPHFPAKAKHIIHIFANGGPSHVDTWDPKPAIDQYAGKEMPGGAPKTERPTGTLYPSPFKFSRHGECGLEASELFAKTASAHADDLCVIRSMHADVPNHEPSLLLMNTGEPRLVRPSYGSWLTYGLGTENQNLPAFIAMCPGGYPIQESQNWQAGFLPGVYQGTYIDTEHQDPEKLIQNVKNRQMTYQAQRMQLDLVQAFNAEHAKQREEDRLIEARIQSFELAYRMQSEAMDVFDVSKEPKHILDMYGPGVQARQMLIARRLVERGVRVVQVWHGEGQPWDSHDHIEKNHKRLAGECDQGIAALLTDLKQRGLLDETLVIWGGEFGRTPTVEMPKKDSNQGTMTGRDHNHYGFTMWLAGGGVKGGQTYGATDEFGFKAVENRVHVHDLHATMLHLLGFDHEKFTYRYAGRDFRLTDVHGRIIRDWIA